MVRVVNCVESARKHKVRQIKTKDQLRRPRTATKVSLKILNCFKNIFEKKNVCILLHKMIQHMQKWGGSPLYPIFELQRI